MTRKHFEAIAEILRENKPHQTAGLAYVTWKNIVADTTIFLSRQNSNFDRTRFESSAGVGKAAK